MTAPSGMFFDIDGVFFVGDVEIPGGPDVVEWAQTAGIPYLFLTNTTSHPRRYLADKLARFGVDVEPEQIFTPAVAAREWLNEHVRGPVALFVPEATAAEFGDLDVLPSDADDGAAAVVVGDLGDQWTFTRLNQAFRLLMRNPAPVLLALGMARYWRDTHGLVLDNGPIAQALAFASGIEPIVTGKPAQAFFEAACARLGVPPHGVIMVGDDIRGDIGGAQSAGLRAVLVRTGKFHPADLDEGIEPEAVLASIADLPDWWTAHRW